MKLQIAQLKVGENELRFNDTRDGWVRDILHHVAKRGYRVEGGMEVDVQLTKLEPDYYLRGQLRFRVHQDCARCAEDFNLNIRHSFELALAHVSGLKKRDDLNAESEELDVNYFEGGEIDLAPMVEEQFFLSLPYQSVCRPDCKGICQQCGKNLNSAECGCPQPNELSPFSVLKGYHAKK